MNTRGQVWVETVLYLVVGLVIMAAVLAFVRPKIEEMQDKSVIDQTLDVMSNMDNQINNIWINGQGNKQIAELKIEKGNFVVRPDEDEIHYILDDSKILYSEYGNVVSVGNVKVLTTRVGSGKRVDLWLNYSGRIDVTYDGGSTEKTFSRSATPYRISIENNGQGIDLKSV